MKPLDQQLADIALECATLRTENARLIAMLEKHGIAHFSVEHRSNTKSGEHITDWLWPSSLWVVRTR